MVLSPLPSLIRSSGSWKAACLQCPSWVLSIYLSPGWHKVIKLWNVISIQVGAQGAHHPESSYKTIMVVQADISMDLWTKPPGWLHISICNPHSPIWPREDCGGHITDADSGHLRLGAYRSNRNAGWWIWVCTHTTVSDTRASAPLSWGSDRVQRAVRKPGSCGMSW